MDAEDGQSLVFVPLEVSYVSMALPVDAESGTTLCLLMMLLCMTSVLLCVTCQLRTRDAVPPLVVVDAEPVAGKV